MHVRNDRQRRFDLLVLDLDGTLVDSRDILVGLVNEVIKGAGYEPADADAVAVLIGLPLDEVFRRALPSVARDAIQALCATYRRRADAAEFVAKFCLYPDVASTLTTLQRSGMRLVIATSKGRATTTDILRHCRVHDLFDHVIGGDCVTRGKPHPEMVHQALALQGTPPERALVVGDTSFDIEMGQAAGAATCAVTYGMHPATQLHQLRPDFMIDGFAALLRLASVGENTPRFA
jgi:phosphoglycolate phosphatase